MNNEYYVITWGPHPFTKRYDDLTEVLVKVQELMSSADRQYIRIDKFDAASVERENYRADMYKAALEIFGSYDKPEEE